MSVDHMNRPKKRWASDREIGSTVLEPHAIPTGATTTPCRVCGRFIALGDHCLSRAWTGGFACITCGWWKLDELDGTYVGEPFVKMLSMRRGQLVDPGWAAVLVQMGLITRDRETKKLAWTPGGQRLASEWRAKHQKEKSA